MTTDTKPALGYDLFSQGADESAKQSKSASNFPDRVPYFTIKKGEKAVLRFLIDAYAWDDGAGNSYPGWIVVRQHSYVPTKPKPLTKADGKPYEGGWSDTRGAVCRKTILPGAGGITIAEYLGDGDGGCFICDHMKKPDNKPYNANGKTWALACLREPVLGDGTEAMGGEKKKGKIVGYKDATREVTREGEDDPVIEKAIVLVNQADSNFFTTLKDHADIMETVLNTDFVVTRKEDGKDTDYGIVSLNNTQLFDLRTPGLLAERYPNLPNLPAIVMEQASEDYFTRFFDTRTENLPGKKPEADAEATASTEGAPAAQQVKPDTDAGVTASAPASAIADRVRGYKPGDGEASTETSTDVPDAQEQAEEAAAEEPTPEADPTAGAAGMRAFG